ncbi:MAG TPA: PHB depolymerase family esterase, partial [Burkholderiaceae bacterium]|nr:PHB depolymerase family esterase [Burkholderiaceae bacterium]
MFRFKKNRRPQVVKYRNVQPGNDCGARISLTRQEHPIQYWPRNGQWLRTICRWIVAIAGFALGALSFAAPVLGTFNVDPARVSVSGFSAGGFFAMQLAIAYSSVFSGVGIFAAGPYDCARQTYAFGCLNNAEPDISGSIANMKRWSGNRIDLVSNIANQRVYIFTGKDDTTVGANVTHQVKRLYVDVGRFIAAEKVKYVELEGATHTFPTD